MTGGGTDEAKSSSPSFSSFVVNIVDGVVDTYRSIVFRVKLLLMEPFVGVIATRKPGCVFKQNDITDTKIKSIDAPAIICDGVSFHFDSRFDARTVNKNAKKIY